MNLKNLFAFSLIVLSLGAASPGRAQMPVGSWRDHLPHNRGVQVVEVDGKIHVATTSGLFIYDSATGQMETLTKANQLSDSRPSALAYDASTQTLVLGYENGNLDLVSHDEVFNLPDIKRKPMSGYKRVNNIECLDGRAYLSCGFGIVALDLRRREIIDTYFIGPQGIRVNVNQTATDGQTLYAATDSGLFQAPLAASNLVDFNAWSRTPQVMGRSRLSSVAIVRDTLLVITDVPNGEMDTTYFLAGGQWQRLRSAAFQLERLRVSQDRLLLCGSYQVRHYADGLLSTPGTYYDYGFGAAQVRDATLDAQGTFWIADNAHGLVRRSPGQDFASLFPPGPAHAGATDFSMAGTEVWVAGGSPSSPWNHLGAYYLRDGQWLNLNNKTVPELENIPNISYLQADHTLPGRVWAGSWGYGVVEFQDGQFVAQYDHTNSPFRNIDGYSNGYIRVVGFAQDARGNLWTATARTRDPVYVRTPDDGQWHDLASSLSLFGIDQNLGDIVVTPQGHVWLIASGKGIYALNPNGTPDNDQDDQERLFSINDREGNLVSSGIYSLALDRDGAVWVGTDRGVVVYSDPGSLFTDGASFYAHRPITEASGIPDYLLKSEIVTAIAIDGANRKWLGTASAGAFLVSSDGTQQISHFYSDNSPLLSNSISAIGINPNDGEVFFATSEGMVSFRGDATQGRQDFEAVKVFPNPVRENFEGVVSITGLVTDVNVKITDVAGNLVYETTANGGQATWDGRNLWGDRVATGVYLIFCTNEDGSSTHIEKLLFIH